MFFKYILDQLNMPFTECKKYGMPLWQCPSFLFLVMGIVIIVAMLITYYIGIHYVTPETVIVIVILVTLILLVVGHSIVTSFDRMAQANRMKGEFISIVSHQLRTPLSSLKWSLDLLRSKRLGETNEKQKEYLDILNESNNRMIDLVSDLLNVNRIEEERLAMRPEVFSLDVLAEDVVKEIEVLAKKHGVAIDFEKSKKPFLVYADPSRIRMVIQNLIENAIKYSKKDTKDRFAEITIEKVNKNKIKCSVKDNGRGIPYVFQGQIFGKFFRGDSLAGQRTEGTGLGLFIAKGIVKLSGGKIGFKSKEGKGSEFWFSLPIAKQTNKSKFKLI